VIRAIHAISSPLHEDLRKHSVHFGRDLLLKSNQRPYINADFFLDYIRTVSLTYLARLLGLVAVAEEVVV
jgi:hypothetical protein